MEWIVDTHAHYDDEAFDGDRKELLSGLRSHGIGTVVNIGASMASCRTTLALAAEYPFIYAAVGVHPNETGELSEGDMDWLKAAAKEKKTVAIGEIGLDYYWDEPDREIQKKWFVRQLELAKETGLPVVIHSRDAAKDTLDIMKSEHHGETGGVIHCFSYGVEIAKEYLDMGYYLGIGGVLTFKNAKKLKEVAEYAPLSRLVLETVLSALGQEEREIVMLHAAAGMKHREIASLLHLPLPTVLSKYNRALKKLREAMKEV